jgi:uncharacterized membrane protein
MRILYWIVATGLMALLVHITTIFWVPTMSGNQAFAVMNRIAAQGGMVMLPEPGDEIAGNPLTSEAIPYRDPYLTIATCRFDLSRGPIEIRGRIVSPYWSFSLHQQDGTYHYGLTQAAIKDGLIHIELRNAAQIRARTLDPDAPITDAIQVEVPFDPGIILIKALSPLASLEPATRDMMEKTTCRYGPNPNAVGS